MDADFEFIDTHAHLYLPQFDEDRDAMMQRALLQGVKKIYLPNIDSSTIEDMLTMVTGYPTICHAMIGLHPGSVNESFRQELDIVTEWLEQQAFSAIGEIGTDLYWNTTFRDQQVDCFKAQISLAMQCNLPIIIHSRETLDLNIDIVSQIQDGSLRGIFHCFTGTKEQANRILDLGFMLGIGGVITFKNSGLSEVVEALPLESIVLETDAPYLTPHPYRGQRNESGHIRLIADKIALCKNESLENIARVTTLNARRLFA